MGEPRTDLHDDLRALIAAGRELSPEHDTVLADMFLDRLNRTTVKPTSGRSLSPRAVRHRVGAALLALALLTGGALVSVQWSSHADESSFPQSSVMKAGPDVKVFPAMPSGKAFVAPAKPAPKGVPPQPKG